mgnify:CR=1 FL=1
MCACGEANKPHAARGALTKTQAMQSMHGPLTSQTHISHVLAIFSRVIDDKWKFAMLENEKIELGACTGLFRARWGLGRRVLPPFENLIFLGSADAIR